MKKFLLLLLAVTINLSLSAQNSKISNLSNVVRVKFNQSVDISTNQNSISIQQGNMTTGRAGFDQLNKYFKAVEMKRVFPIAGKFEKKHKQYGLHLWFDIHVEEGNTLESLLESYGALSYIETAEPVGVYAYDDTANVTEATNDPRLNDQWHYNNNGQTGGLAGADISLFSAWEKQTGDNRVVVSLHDSGIDYNHPDLDNILWTNKGEVPNDGIDNDNNGYIDDYHGYNFAAAVVGGDPSNVYDYGGHGTHTAGTIAAENNNGIGVAGVAGGSGFGDGIRIMMMRLGDDNGSSSIYNPAPSFIYAADMGAVISSNSWGGGGYSQSIYDAIQYFVNEAGGSSNGLNGGVVVISSGNSNSSSPDYRSTIPNVIMVAATNHNDQRSFYSNYGTWIDISAPGGETSISSQGVLSTLPNNSYGYYQGTSMACPHVSGVAALLVSKSFGSNLTNTDLVNALISSADPIDRYNSGYEGLLGSGRINADAALDLVAEGSGRTNGGLIIDPSAIYAELKSNVSKEFSVKVFNSSVYQVNVKIEEEVVDWMTVSAANLTIPPNGTGKFKVTLTGGTAGELLENNITLSYTGLDSEVKNVLNVSLYTLGRPEINTVDSLFYEMTYQGDSSTQTLTINNSGTGYLTIDSVVQSSDYFDYIFEPITISPSGVATLDINFKPSDAGQLVDAIIFKSNDPNSPNHKVILVGVGNPNNPPQIELTPAAIERTLQSPSSGQVSFTVKNTGGDPLRINLSLNPYNELNLDGENKHKTADEGNGPSSDAIGSMLNNVNSPVDSESGLAWDGSNMWIADRYSNHIYKYDLVSETILDTIYSAAENGVTLAFDGTNLWEHDLGLQLIRYDMNGVVDHTIALSSDKSYNYGIAFDGNGIWMSDYSDFIKIDKNDGSLISKFSNSSARYSTSIESIGNSLILVYNGTIYKVQKGSYYYQVYGSMAGKYNAYTADVTFDGSGIWVTMNDIDKLVKVEIFQDFLYLQDNQYVVDPGASLEIPVNYYLEGFDDGLSYHDDIIIVSNSVTSDTVTIPFDVVITGQPVIDIDKTSIILDAYLGYDVKDSIKIQNQGNVLLEISSISSSSTEFVFDDTPLSISPYETYYLPITATLNALDTIEAILTIASNDINNATSTVSLKAIGKKSPSISIDLNKIDISLYEEELDSVAVTIVNSGEGDLHYFLINEPVKSSNESQVVDASETYTSNITSTSKETKLEYSQFEIYTSNPVIGSSNYQSSSSTLDEVLTALTEGFSQITSLVPSKFNFYDGTSGYDISDGGRDMYDGGNSIATNIGGYITYSDRVIRSNSYFNNEDYFTFKEQGLFVLSANLDNVASFTINGNLGADGSGSVDGATLSFNIASTEYLGFVKRVYNANDPSVNHLIIVENNGQVNHEFSTNSDSDYHQVNYLHGVDRIHYLLFASEYGGYIDNESMLSIMESYLVTIGESGGKKELLAGESVTDYIYFDTNELDSGTYQYDILLSSNDLSNSNIKIPTNFTVASAPRIVTVESYDLGQSYVGATNEGSIFVENVGSDTLYLSELELVDGSIFSFELANDTIPPHQRVLLGALRATPTDLISYSTALTFVSNDPVNPTVSISLTTTGIPSAILAIDDLSVTDSLAIGESSSYELTVSNQGTEPLAYSVFIQDANSQLLQESIDNLLNRSGIYEGNLSYQDQDGKTITTAAPSEVAGLVNSIGTSSVLILGFDYSSRIQNVVDQLINSQEFGSVAYINLGYTVVTYSDLSEFDAILYWNANSYQGQSSLGDVFAKYVDNGGGIVTATSSYVSNPLGGKWDEALEKYTLFNKLDFNSISYRYGYLGDVALPEHQLMKGVSNFSGGNASFRSDATAADISTSATLVASWQDGSPLIVVGNDRDIKRVHLGFYPVSSLSSSYYWDVSTSGTQILVNSIKYVKKRYEGTLLDWISSSKYFNDNFDGGTSENLTFEINTEQLKEGDYSARAIFSSNDSRRTTQSRYFDIHVDGLSELSVPDTIYFNSLTIGDLSTRELVIRNQGNGSTEVAMLLDTLGSFSLVLGDTILVESHANRSVSIQYNAQSVGVYYDMIEIEDLRDGFKKSVVLVAEVDDPGVIRLNPQLMELNVEYQQSIDTSFFIHNDGEGDLKFSFNAFRVQDQISSSQLNDVSFISNLENVDKGSEDNRMGHPVQFGIGKDDYGYQYIDSNEENGPVYDWKGIAPTGTSILLEDDDYKKIELPFEFPFYGTRGNHIFISTNGLIGFDAVGVSNPINAQIPRNTAPNGFISPFWKDLIMGQNSKILYQIFEERVVIQYNNMKAYDESGIYTFQVIMYSSGDIVIHYKRLSGKVSDVTVGIESDSGEGLQIAFNTDYLKEKMAISIIPPTERINPQITQGIISPGDSLEIPFTYSSLNDLGGGYSHNIAIASNDTIQRMTILDLSIMVDGISTLGLFRDSVRFDSTYAQTVSRNPVWLKNDSVGVLSVREIVTENPNFSMVFPAYKVFNFDEVDSIVFWLNYQTESQIISGEVFNVEDKFVAFKIFENVNSRPMLIAELNIEQSEMGGYLINSRLNLTVDQLWKLSKGELYANLYTTDHLDGVGVQSFVPTEANVLPFEYSQTFAALYKPLSAQTDTAYFTFKTDAINNDEISLTTIGTGLSSGTTIRVDNTWLSSKLNVGDSTELSLNISNDGKDTLRFDINLLAFGFESNYSPAKTMKQERSQNPNHVSNDELGYYPFSESSNPTSSPANMDTSEGYFAGNIYINNQRYIGYSSTQDPSQVYNLKLWDDQNFSMASEFVVGSSSLMYDLNLNGQLTLIDLENESSRLLADLGLTTCTGMTTDPETGDLYISANGNLFLLDVNDYSLTDLGVISNSIILGIAIDSSGDLYSYDLSDNLYVTNLLTRQTTLLGYIGFDANYGQDMAYDISTNEIYMAAFNATESRAEFRRVDRVTGNTELIDLMGKDYNGFQMGSLAFTTNYTNNGPMRLSFFNGTLAPGEDVDLGIKFNAIDLLNGSYSTIMKINSNDDSHPTLRVPMTLEVYGNDAKVGEYSNALNFGLSTVMDTTTLQAQISNNGKAVLTLVLQNQSPQFSSSHQVGDTVKIDIGSAISFPITFVPNQAKTFELDMRWTTNDPEQNELIISLAGAGERSPQELGLSFETLEIELVRNQDLAVDFLLSSVGKDTCEYSLSISQSLSWIVVDSINGKLAPDSTLIYPIEFSSNEVEIGDYKTELVLTSNDPMFRSFDIPISLTVVNQSIIQTKPIEGGLLAIGDQEDHFYYTLNEYFMDPDGDEISYRISSSQQKVDFLFVDGELDVFGLAKGLDTLSIESIDNFGDTLTAQIYFRSNTRTRVGNLFDDVSLIITDEYVTMYNLFNFYFIDDDLDILDFNVTSDKADIADVFINTDNQLIANPKSIGSMVVTVEAFDGSHYQYQSFSITVGEVVLGVEFGDDFLFYPNPVVNNLLHVSFPSTGIVQLQIINLLGSVVHSLDVNSTTTTYDQVIDLSHLDNGVYIIRAVSNEEEIYVDRIIKK